MAGGQAPTGGFNPAALNSLSPAAGHDEDEELSPEELNHIEAAAGSGARVKSWGEAAYDLCLIA